MPGQICPRVRFKEDGPKQTSLNGALTAWTHGAPGLCHGALLFPTGGPSQRKASIGPRATMGPPWGHHGINLMSCTQ
ncbi:unnamed protein product [Boreogadus saida]